MKPLDPRLLRHARAARRYIVITTITGILTAGLVVAQAVLISRAIAPVILRPEATGQVGAMVAGLIIIVATRCLVLYLQEALAHRAATRTIIELRRAALEHAAALGPRWQAEHGAATATLLTRGLEDLEPYFTRYLPQLLLAATVTPATIAVLATQDIPSTITVILTIPLIPLFMILIGRMTQSLSQERLAAMERLGSQVLDLIAGLPTLKALGRERGPADRVRALGRDYRLATMSTLRIAFLSGAVLEFLTTLSVAIIAVAIGFRLIYGTLDLPTALLALMIAPEAYQPLRQVGFHFHASANGVAAAQAVFEILEAPLRPRGTRPAPALGGTDIHLEGVGVRSRGRWAPYRLSARIPAGGITALTGPSGAGKTTTAQVVLGLLPPDEGRVVLRAAGQDASTDRAGTDLAGIEPSSWWEQISWVPQRPVIVPGSVLDNVLSPARDAAPAAPSPADSPAPRAVPQELVEAARITGLDEVLRELPEGWHTMVGQGGVRLSLGQRQRLALTRALSSPAPLVVMDEPTAHLDASSEAHVLRGVRALASRGRTVLVIAHRAALIALADHVIEVRSGPPDDAAAGDGASTDASPRLASSAPAASPTEGALPSQDPPGSAGSDSWAGQGVAR